MSYNIKLDVFEGPLDLLLHLIKDNQVEIYDIPIASVTEQYLEFMDMMKDLNLDVAGEYLVMASTLTYIKSRMLLPPEDTAEEIDDLEGQDPRDELVQKLLEYKKFKEAALKLREAELTQSHVFTRPPQETEVPEDGELLVEVSVFELIKSFKRILDRIGDKAKKFSLTLEEISVTDKLNEIVSRLEEVDHVTFDSLFETARARMEVIATFLALLELTRLKLVRAHQSRVRGEILIYKLAESGNAFTESEFDAPTGEVDDDIKSLDTPDNLDNENDEDSGA